MLAATGVTDTAAAMDSTAPQAEAFTAEAAADSMAEALAEAVLTEVVVVTVAAAGTGNQC
jgi:hypothetical protein